MTQTVLAGMGAIPVEEGVGFRVWAPGAEEVCVVGDFNDWKVDADCLVQEANGHWYCFVEGASSGDAYKFRLMHGGLELFRVDPYAREVTNSVGNGVVQDPFFDWADDRFVLAPLNELVIYEMHIGSFHRKTDDRPGTFADAAERLGHLAELGVNCVELMPVTEFAGDWSWGYNPAHPFAVESCYGGSKGLKAFVKAAHEKGIGVILDVVYNHFGPSDLDLWRFDGWGENDGGGIYFYNDWRAETPWGMTRPDYGRPEVRTYIRDNALMWLEDYRMDGLRFDATVYIRTARGPLDPGSDIPEGWTLVQELNSLIRDRFPGKITIAEDLQDNDWLTKPVSEGGAGFHAQWSAQFVHPLRAALTASQDEHRSMHALVQAAGHAFNGDAFQSVIYSESHDEVANGKQRVPEEIEPGNADGAYSQKRSTLGAVFVLTTPGIPMLFQGQEFLEGGWFQDSVALDWTRNDRFHGITRIWHDLIQLRLNRNGLSRGLSGSGLEFLVVDDERNLLVYRRWQEGGEGDDVVVAINFSGGAQEGLHVRMPASRKWHLRLNTDWEGYGDAFGNAEMSGPSLDVESDGEGWVDLKLGPYSALIYS